MTKNFRIGIDTSGDRNPRDKHFNAKAMKAMGLDFLCYKYGGVRGKTIKEACAEAVQLAKECEENGLKFYLNVETGNFNEQILSAEGYDWANREDGNHLFKVPDEILEELAKYDSFMGLQYDEMEHSQLTRNLSLTLDNPKCDMVTLGETTGMTFEEADNCVYENAKALVESVVKHGDLKVYSEHVWPVLFHNFARAGITPAYKQMKEHWSNVWAACAMGASLQYNRELFSCVDFWNHNTYPGHSPEEMWGNMLFAYWAGIDAMYIEATHRGIYDIVDGDCDNIVWGKYGEKLLDFSNKYIKENVRDYTFRDYEPATAIIRFDDTEWGQGENHYCTVDDHGTPARLYWIDYLFGSKTLKTSPESEEWIKAWSTITHGNVKENSMSWNYAYPYKGMPHRSFAPAYAPIVYDDTVSKELMQTLRLAFLCGLKISDSTYKAVCELVKENGLTVVTSKRFAPAEFTEKYNGGTAVFADGKGKWVITDNMTGEELKKEIAPLLGNSDEIVYKFKGGKEVIMKISEDGNELTVERNF